MTHDEIKNEAESFLYKDSFFKDEHLTEPDEAVAFAKHCVEIERERIRRLIADDAYACEFQSMGQYRSALLGRLQQLPPAPEAA